MLESEKEVLEYELPYKQNCRLKLSTHILYIVLIAFFTLGAFFFPTDDNEALVLKVFFILFTLFLLILWLYMGILKRSYLEITKEYIKTGSLFGSKTITWDKAADVSIYKQNHNTMIGIITKEKLSKRKDSLGTLFSDLFGGTFSLAISLMIYPDIDIERLYLTISNRIESQLNKEAIENQTNLTDEDTIDIQEYQKKNSSFLISLFKCIFASFAIGILYGYSMYFFNKNFLLIPLIGLIIILYLYNKNYEERAVNFVFRLLIGLTCTIQIFVADMLSIYLTMKLPLQLDYISEFLRYYFKYLLSVNGVMVLIIAFVLFVVGTFQGYQTRLQRQLSKFRMKKIGNYYYKKDGNRILVYLIDPADFDDTDPENQIAIIYILQIGFYNLTHSLSIV
ncbi:hypothetical protein [Clostridium manihotivorum]|uniref:Uncharacterized protein n=1 Tax=Clostridium manihotivorum TaxID=2320868 RepID=A0A3R5U6J0_9CLOT|nr:hypothetical protein [Clostridium manihotivorum]QAA33155.1 hypothetical protein C1I91_16765 [Clostridium manihotivorum]